MAKGIEGSCNKHGPKNIDCGPKYLDWICVSAGLAGISPKSERIEENNKKLLDPAVGRLTLAPPMYWMVSTSMNKRKRQDTMYEN